MRFQLTEIITRPEPSVSPAATLFLALTIGAVLAVTIAVTVGAIG